MAGRDYPEEAADSIAPGTLGFRIDDGKLTQPYYVDGDTLDQTILDVLGYNLDGTYGEIHRVLPRAHPRYPFLIASSANVVGYGVPEILDAEESYDAEAIADQYGLYPDYTLLVEFLQRPYHVLSDDSINLQSDLWYDDQGVEQPFHYVNEYDRFVEIDEDFDPKVITATQGQMVFRTKGEALPHNVAFAGQPRIPYPEEMLRLKWHQVPYRYLSSRKSFLKRFALRINQLPLAIQDYEFEPGELLFLGYKYRRYTPPFPPIEHLNFGLGFELEKWVDIDMTFMVARRTAPDPPELPNQNWIAAGHNLLPWFGPIDTQADRRGFHCVTTYKPSDATNKDYWMPVYRSAPLQLLFMDPDAPQPSS